MKYEAFVGLEVHSELNTKTKAFCSCKVSFGEKPNTNCCPVCLGMPGTLPSLNEKVVEYAVRLGIATNCSINLKSKNARKNYFYPDLAKGYQISQNEIPLCKEGYINLSENKIRLNRIHIEEDAGKLIHTGEKTLIDYNRAGVPLLEIVTEPDIKSAREAGEFLEKIRRILLDIEISDCKMQEGSLRCDVNVSVRPEGQKELGERCELKNINSISAVVKSVEHETRRQISILEAGGVIERETRRWDSEKNESILMRSKENLQDYRYIPEPDIPPIVLSEEKIEKIKAEIPELFDKKVSRYVKDYNLSKYDAEQIAKDKNFTALFEEAVKLNADAKTVANFVMCDISAYLSKNNLGTEEIPFSGEDLMYLADLVKKKTITHTAAKEVLEEMFAEKKKPREIVKEKSLTQISDKEYLQSIVKKVLDENEKSVTDYKKGKTNALGYLVGQCMKNSKNRANPTILKELIIERLEEME